MNTTAPSGSLIATSVLVPPAASPSSNLSVGDVSSDGQAKRAHLQAISDSFVAMNHGARVEARIRRMNLGWLGIWRPEWWKLWHIELHGF